MSISKKEQKEGGVVSTGHPASTAAGEEILRQGGNAFDAILASFFAACVCEPSFASLGGGGFLTFYDAEKKESKVYDFFAQTPRQKNKSKLHFYPTEIDFGGAVQEFHIGRASVATPGAIFGALEIHRNLCSLPLKTILQPAIKIARDGVRVNEMTAFTFVLLKGIFQDNDEIFKIYRSHIYPDRLPLEGEIMTNKDLADTYELLIKEGEEIFRSGKIAKLLVENMKDGGHLQLADLQKYEVITRKPVEVDYRNHRFITNPPPSAGGILIAHTLSLLNNFDFHQIRYRSAEHIELLARAMEETNEVRAQKVDGHLQEPEIADTILNKQALQKSIRSLSGRVNKLGGTTHLSVVDADGNIASMTVTNGEGSGYVIPGTGIIMNNMLGEEDLNPQGFHKWKENQRISSMMAPSILLGNGLKFAVGSAGSNRIRSAIMQIVVNIVDFNKSIEEAVNDPRIHFENGRLDIEPGGVDPAEEEKIKQKFDQVNIWNKKSLFFGGANCAVYDSSQHRFFGAGDIRRGGQVKVL